MNRIIGIGLIVLAIALGYMGITTVSDSGGSVEVIGIELSAQDDGMKTQGYIYLGLAVISFIGGISMINKK